MRGIVSVFLALVFAGARAQERPPVHAEEGSVAIGGNVSGSTINVGLTPEQVQELTKATAARAVGPLADRIVDLSNRLGVTQGAVLAMLGILGQRDVPLEQLPQKLAEVATQFQKLQAQLAALDPRNPLARGLVEQAQAEVKAGNFAKAHELLGQAKQAQIAAAQQARELRQKAQEAEPLEWARTQDNLGNALTVLGGRDSGTARLEEAVAAFRDALQENTRARVPLQWARTQMNLGNALRALGERESGTARLEEAVAEASGRAGRRGSKRRSPPIAKLCRKIPARAPLEWAKTQMNLGARTQMNLGIALETLGERESGTARLEEAVAAYREALQENTRARVPLQWARTQLNLALVDRALFDKDHQPRHLDEALEAADGALEEFRKAKADFYIEKAGRQRGQILAMKGNSKNRAAKE